MRGLQDGAQWPMLGYCPTRISRGPFNGPQTTGPLVDFVALGHGPLTSPVIDADGNVYVAGDDAIVALRPDLSPWWTQKINGPTYNFQTDTSPVVAKDGTVWVGSATHELWAATQGAVRSYSVGFFFGSPVIDPSGTLIFPTGAGESLRGVDATGKQLFDVPVQGATLHTAPARGWDGSIFVGTVGQVLAAVRPPKDFMLGDMGGPASDFETPLVHPSGLVLAEVGGGQSMQLAAFDVTGKFAWKIDIPGATNFSNGAAVGADGLVYTSTSEGIVIVDVGAKQVTGIFPLDTAPEATRTPSLGADGTIYVTKGPTLYGLESHGEPALHGAHDGVGPVRVLARHRQERLALRHGSGRHRLRHPRPVNCATILAWSDDSTSGIASGSPSRSTARTGPRGPASSTT